MTRPGIKPWYPALEADFSQCIELNFELLVDVSEYGMLISTFTVTNDVLHICSRCLFMY